MWPARIWVILIAAAVAAAVGAAIIAPGPGGRDMADAHGYKLDLIQHNAHLLLKLDRRQQIDAAARMTRDTRLADALNEASSARGKDLQALRERANAAMLDLVSQIKAESRPELFIVVDSGGKQLARIGSGEDKTAPGTRGLAGYPLVEAALRGYLRDDTWSLDGRLYMMAAAPVISRNGTRYVGALILGQAVDKQHALHLKERLVATHVPFLAHTDIAFFLRGKMVASTISSTALTKLPLQYGSRRQQLLQAGRSAALRIGSRGSRHLVVMAPLPGEAYAHEAFYAVVTPLPPRPALLATVARTRWADFGVGGMLKVFGTFLALLIVGLLLLHITLDVPHRKLQDDLKRLTRGDINRLPKRQYAVRQQDLAQTINDFVDRVANRRPAAPAPQSSGSAADADRAEPPAFGGGAPQDGLMLDPGTSMDPQRHQPLSSPPAAPVHAGLGDQFQPAHGGAMPPLAPGAAAAAPLPPLVDPGALGGNELNGNELGGGQIGELVDELGVGELGVGGLDAGELGVGGLSVGELGASLDNGMDEPTNPESGAARLAPLTGPIGRPGSSPEPGPSGFAADLPLLRPVDLHSPAQPGADHVPANQDAWQGPVTAASEPLGGPSVAVPLQGPPSDPGISSSPLKTGPLQQTASAEENDTVMSSVPQHLAKSLRESAPHVQGAPLVATAMEDPQEAHFQDVFREFVAVKRSCGESTERLTYERFSAKLRKNAGTLMSKYNCHGVRFKVYVKDGKAALKATPVQD